MALKLFHDEPSFEFQNDGPDSVVSCADIQPGTRPQCLRLWWRRRVGKTDPDSDDSGFSTDGAGRVAISFTPPHYPMTVLSKHFSHKRNRCSVRTDTRSHTGT